MKSHVKQKTIKNKENARAPFVQVVKHAIKNENKEHSVTQKKEVTRFSKVTHSAKRYGKVTLKNMLLSKTFHIVFKIASAVLVFLVVSYCVYLYLNRSFKNDVVVSKSEIVDRVSKLTALPNETPKEVVRVEDPETLKKQNSFYQNVKAGDYILMYSSLAVIYDLRNNSIIAVKKQEGK